MPERRPAGGRRAGGGAPSARRGSAPFAGSAERALVARLAGVFGSPPAALGVGIGDDAAVIDLSRPGAPRGKLVWTVDTQVEGVHFRRDWLSLGDVGYRSFMAAASDLAAMGAAPLGALSALELPRAMPAREALALARGQARAARALGCPVLGGNLAAAPALAVTTTVLGVAARPLLRSGARPGDELWLLGAVGLAALGLRQLAADPASGGVGVRAWRHPRALLAEGLTLVGRARAAIDVSDGLGCDAAELARASGVALVLERAALLRALPAALRRLGDEPALALALAGGEDYALLAAGPARRRPAAAARLGRAEVGRGVWLERADGARRAVEVPGFDHRA